MKTLGLINLHPQGTKGLCVLSAIFMLASGASAGAYVNLTVVGEKTVFRVNDTVQMICRVNHRNQTISASNIVWSANGVELKNANVQILDSTTSNLTLERVQFEHSAQYECRLDGWFDTLEIEVGLPPEKATNVTCISHDFVSLDCTWDNGPFTNLNTSYTLQYKPELLTKWSDCNVTNGCLLMVNGIFKEYYMTYRINSSNALGSVTSESKNINMKREIILNPPRLLRVTNATSSSLHVSWQARKEYMKYGSDILRYRSDILYKVLWESEQSGGTKVIEMDQKLEHTFTSLKPNSVYYFSVVAKCEQCTNDVWSEQTELVKGRTSETAPDAGVSLNLHCRKINKTKAELTWESFPENKSNGRIQAYVINITNTQYNIIRGPDATKYETEELDLQQDYNFSIVARNSIGDSQADSCSIHAEPRAPSVVPVVGIIVGSVGLLLSIVGMFLVYHHYKKVMINFPDIKLPHHIHNDNFYADGGPQRHPPREKEMYDQLITQTPTVEFTLETEISASSHGVITNGFTHDSSTEPIMKPEDTTNPYSNS